MHPVTTPQTLIRRARHKVFALSAPFVSIALAFALTGAPAAFAISRNDVLTRAQRWVDSPVGYSQSKHHLGYRTDCSGYVSMCWKTGTSWSTRSFHTVSHRIRVSSLKPGDALLKKGYHIRLFYGWLDEAHTTYVAYESGNGKVAVARIHSIQDDLDFGYHPARFDRISNSPAPRSLLHNGSFNTWARSWGSQAEEPVWWQVEGPWGQTLARHAKKTYRTARNSMKLVNPSGDPAELTGVSQSVRVVAGEEYRASAWAKTASPADGLELKLVYLDAAGAAVAETSTTGATATIDNSAFKRMSVQLVAPADAVRALVSVRLAGSSTLDTTGTVIATGSSVFLDDISLTRP